MKRLALILSLALALGACGSEKVVYLTPEEAQARKDKEAAAQRVHLEPIIRKLPPGCEFRDLGNYERGGWSPGYPIFAIFCGKTVTTGSLYQVGKSMQFVGTTTNIEEGS